MNHKCQGDFFTADGESFYRCLFDGRLVTGAAQGSTCPICCRQIEALTHGELPVRVIVTREVTLKNGWCVELPAEVKESAT